jgi:hypothetical protein
MTADLTAAPPKPPPVVFWYKVYVVFNVLMYLAVAAVIAAISLFASDSFKDELGPAMILIVMAGACGFFAIAYLVSLFFPRRPWAWVYDLVFTGCFTLPFSVALLIFWIKPEAKGWFGMS